MADRLGIDQATFKAWSARLGAARDYLEPPESAADILRKLCPGRRQRARVAEISTCVSVSAIALLILDGAGWHSSPHLIVPENIVLMPLSALRT